MNSLKILLKIGFTATLAYLFQITFPWWSIAIAAFIISLIISTKGFSSFLAGFLGIAMLWFFMALIIDINTKSILTDRIAAIFSLPNSISMVFATAFVGGLVGGLSALTGSTLRSWILPTETNY